MFGRFFMFQAWLSLVHQNLDAVRTGVTPITKLLRERNTSQPAQPQTQQKLEEAQQIARRVRNMTSAQHTIRVHCGDVEYMCHTL